MKFDMPTNEQFEELADALDGMEETWGNTLVKTLESLGLDVDLKHSVNFTDMLEDHIFHCEDCDCWKRIEVRVYNPIAERKMCEDCDENY
ncbi:hypothetical protein CPT_Morttis_198 [Acinetobacter phage Morttis]|nr:hypothetical protein CPT_Maestro_204 [Acinetobacter phage Maestro]QQM18684.1 hypothetical protein CPT_Morttis_198 [Acinetobacter phage Morttis]